ncbi:hypothetical protein AB1K32_27235 [Metabacillus dongyingensis]|uniref:hypothetical protein n=1 Tax=Metabacillus dongyingensis TaxID=2874282 RepID=UPI001FB51089|nr:hypothetical protein [Metabacillus dongyingensis]UNJ81414.1 hypothetical protein [Metabacillus dongyingensis]USK31440.1 hypothetical protein LIT32_25500 [Bacillus sp. CMF21]
MDTSMSVEEVKNQISGLMQKEGQSLRKKQVKKSNPELMKNALYYFPSWETAIEQSVGS